ncbi:MAG: sel1 repeat family protein, partial [Albidovulum sp.]
MRWTLLCLAALGFAAPARADEAGLEEAGTLNPEEMTIARILDDAERGITSMTNCAAGYYITKSGRHVEARRLFERCTDDGYTGAMTWMSQLDDNGLGAPENPDSA